MLRSATVFSPSTVVFLAFGLVSSFLCAATARAQHTAPSHPSSTENGPAWEAAPAASSEAEVKERAQKLVVNQHKDDEALKEFERIERHTDFTGGSNPKPIEDKVFRIVPTGSGTLRILLKDNGTATDPAEYRRQLEAWHDVLELMLRTDDPRTKTAYEKYDRRNHQRAQLVDSMVESFAATWLRRESRDGRLCDVFELKPKPNFHPHNMMQDALSHIVATIWVDRATDQMVRGEAHITRDISFGGGILGKVYRGGVFSMEQGEVAPGIWEPTKYTYDFEGRKFLFSFDEHQVVDASHYRRVGPPKEALAIVQDELASNSTPAEPQ
ncbi:MAG TPA: hypothetical protein VG322_00700 [Candidatus Acidoferrales bacterium]|jgi:hypothetical protein|nr:hypothetical protein [Candidatus Acidoferrales bacterium]